MNDMVANSSSLSMPILFLIGIIIGIVIFVLYQILFPKDKSDEYIASNSFRASPGNQKQYRESAIIEKQEKIIIKGFKFGSEESAAILDAIRKGNNVEATWLIRSIPGISLKDAKDFIASVEKKLNSKSNKVENQEHNNKDTLNTKNKSEKVSQNHFQLNKVQMESLIAALENDNLIASAKIIREASGLGLKEAKEIVDEIALKSQNKAISEKLIEEVIHSFEGHQLEESNTNPNNKKKSNVYTLSKSDYDTILKLLDSGNKIEAVRHLSEATGLNLNEASQNIHKLEAKRNQNNAKADSSAGNLNSEQSNQVDSKLKAIEKSKTIAENILLAIANGTKLEAIKIFGETTHLGLLHSKDFIDGLENRIKQASNRDEAIKKSANLLALELIKGKNADIKKIIL